MRIVRTLFAISIILASIMAFGQISKPSAEDVKKERAQIAKLEKQQAAAKVAHAKSPNDGKLTKGYEDLTFKLAEAYMYSRSVVPKVRYVKALHYYRETLKVNPKNQKAQDSADMIVKIYKQMGKPVPPG